MSLKMNARQGKTGTNNDVDTDDKDDTIENNTSPNNKSFWHVCKVVGFKQIDFRWNGTYNLQEHTSNNTLIKQQKDDSTEAQLLEAHILSSSIDLW